MCHRASYNAGLKSEGLSFFSIKANLFNVKDTDEFKSHHPSSDKISHPCPHRSNLHKTLIPDAHVFCHHVRPARKESARVKRIYLYKKKKKSSIRVQQASTKGRRQEDWQNEPRGKKRKWSLCLSIMMLAVRVNQYQSNAVKTMSDGSTFHKALRIVNNLHQRNGIYAVSLLSFGPAVFGKLSICLANLPHV